MKEIKNIIKIIFTVIIVLFVFIFNNRVNASTIDETFLNESSLVSYNNLSEFVTDKNDSIILSYTYNGDNRISVESIYESSEVNLTLSSIDNEGNFIIYINVIKLGEVIVKINIIENNNDVIYSIYINIYSTNEYNYVSQNSMECAKRLFLVNNYEEVDFSSYSEFIYGNNINVTKIDNNYMLLNSDVNEIELNNLNNKTIVKLLLEWEDKNSVLHPVKNIKVEILNSGQTLETLYSNDEGVCVFNIDNLLFGQGNSLNLSFRIISENEYIKLVSKKDDNSTLYSRTTDPVEVIKNDSTNSFSFIADYASSDFENSIQIHQMLNMMGEYVYRIKDEKLPQIQVKYPHTGCSFAWDYINIRQTAYDDWDAVMHEYGHYIVYYYDLFETFPTGNHSPSQNLIVSYGKSKGISLAWSEAIATFFAISAQYLIDDSSPKIPDVRDNNYRSDVAGNTKLKEDYLDGEGSENCTIGLLLSLADNQSDDCFSSEVVNYEYLFNLIIDNKIETLNEFITCLYNENILPTYEYGEILSYFKVAPNISIENDEMASFPNAITLSWEAQGGRGDSNDTFNIYILDNEYEIISTYTNIRSTTYSIIGDNLIDIINHIVENENYKIYLQIEGFATSAPITGGYFSNLKEIEVITDAYTLSNYSALVDDTIIIDANSTKYYMITSNYNKYYEFIVDGTYGVDIKLYDENFNEILVDDLNDSNSIEHIINQLQVGTYYLEIKNSSSSTNSTSIKIVSRTTAYIGVGDNDVLLNTHNYNEGIYTSNYYYYINNRGVGFYRFTLTGVKADGTTVTYPYNSIMIKDHMNEDIIDKYSLTGYSNQAISGYNENTFVAYLNATGYFYVYIDIDTEGLKSLTLNIEPVESETIDLFTKSESTNSTMEILDSETTKGDYAKKIILKQAGEFTVNYSYSGSQSNDILFVLGKLNYNSTTQKYTIETLISQLMDAENDSFTYTLDLTDGTYFVAYFNKDDNAAFDVTFNRLVTQYGGSVLIPDPDSMTDGGSQVEVYEKGLPYYEVSYRGTNIVIGFTRVIYIDYHYVDQHSREDYYWYSSNDSIATVSQHGTVFGKSAGTVKIMAVNKDDPSIVFVKQFTVVQDTKTYSEVIYSEFNDTHKLSNGEYQLGLDVQNSPYPMTQYYSWRVVSKSSTITSVSIDQWGNVAIVGTGNIVIEGYNYIYNDNYGVRINLTVTN